MGYFEISMKSTESQLRVFVRCKLLYSRSKRWVQWKPLKPPLIHIEWKNNKSRMEVVVEWKNRMEMVSFEDCNG